MGNAQQRTHTISYAARLTTFPPLHRIINPIMSRQTHNFPTSLSAEACTEIFTYIVVVFVFVKFSIDDLSPEARRRQGRFPPSGWLYLAGILFWPVTIGTFAGLLVLGVSHTALRKVYELGARGTILCRGWINTIVCGPKSREVVVEDLEMGPLVPSPLGGVSWVDDVDACDGWLQSGLADGEAVMILKEECGLTPEKWGRINLAHGCLMKAGLGIFKASKPGCFSQT